MEMKAGVTYTVADFPTTPDGTDINTIEIVDATLLTGLKLKDDGSQKTDTQGSPSYALTTMRGIRIRIDAPNVKATAVGDKTNANVAGVYQVGQQIIFDLADNYEYVCIEGSAVVALGEAIV